MTNISCGIMALLVPLRYLVPNEDIPVINLSVTLAANLEETYKWGQAIANVLRETEKKVVFVASGALAHNLVRGRHHMPTFLNMLWIKSLLN